MASKNEQLRDISSIGKSLFLKCKNIQVLMQSELSVLRVWNKKVFSSPEWYHNMQKVPSVQ